MFEEDVDTGKINSVVIHSLYHKAIRALEAQDPLTMDVLAYQYDIVCNGVGSLVAPNQEPPA